MKIAVTGASGFIGSRLCATLSEKGLTAVPVERAELLEFKFVGCDAVVHLAGIAHRTDVDTADYMRINRDLAVELARHARDQGVARFVFVSSVAAMHPVNDYGRSKVDAENRLKDIPGAVIVRPPLVYGAGAPGNMASIMKLARLPVLLPFGSATRLRSLIFIDNLCDALLFAATAKNVGYGPYVVTDGEDVSLAQIITGLRAGLGRRPGLFKAPWLEPALKLAGRSALAEKLLGELRFSSADFCQLGWKAPVPPMTGLALCLSQPTT